MRKTKKRKAPVKPVISLDIAFNNTGWVVINSINDKIIEVGVFNTVKQKGKGVRVSFDDARRCGEMARQFYDVCCEHEVKAVVGELPSGGGITASAVKSMAYATSIFPVVAELAQLPCEWTDPGTVKLALCGRRNATKEEMIKAACKKFGIEIKKKARGRDYIINGVKYGEGKFEHIADALGAYLACKTGNLLKIL